MPAHGSQVCVTVCVNRAFYVGFIRLQDLTKQLDEVTQNSEIVEIRQKEAECELEAARDRVQQQATEILLKASKTISLSSLLFSSLLIWTYIYTATNATHKTHPGFVMLTHQTYPLTDPLILSEKSLPLTL